jgi:hypothetical protein
MIRAMDPETPDERPRSSFEDLSDIGVPAPMPSRPRRTAIVSMAALVLTVSAVMNAIVVIALSPEGAARAISGVLAVTQGVAAVLAMSGLITVALNGYVIYALASSGPAFRRG